MAWPLIAMIGLACVGVFFSRLWISEGYHLSSLAAATVLTALFLTASVVRYRSGRMHFPNKFPFNRAWSLVVFSVPFLYAFNYAAIAHGIPAMLFPLLGVPDSHMVVISDKHQTGYRSGFRHVLEADGVMSFPGCPLCVSEEFWHRVSVGDTLTVDGKRSIFGFVPESFRLTDSD